MINNPSPPHLQTPATDQAETSDYPLDILISLESGEKLSDRPPEIRGRCVIIEGETGIGKTHYVLDYLAQSTPVILLLPTVSQIRQIEETRAGHAISFVHGNSQPDQLECTIVGTYDQLGRIAKLLGEDLNRFVLVVDEVHKLYQAGGYRPVALQGIFDAIDKIGEPNGFECMIGLSATIQPELLDFEVDQWVKVETADRVTRTVSIVEYHDLKKYWVEALLEYELLPIDSLNVIRLNDANKLEESSQIFEQRGYNCLVVHSKIQDEDDIQQMLAEERVDDRINLLLTTSLIDEGININNNNLGCVHLVGDIHSAELHQFIGRFRSCNPDIYLHVQRFPTADNQALDHSNHAFDLPNALNLDRQVQMTMLDFCNMMLRDAKARGKDISGKLVKDYVKKLNETHRRFYDFDLLLARMREDESWEVDSNRPGLMAHIYSLDIANHYVSMDTLCERLKSQFGSCEIIPCAIPWLKSPNENGGIKEDLKAAKDMRDEERRALIDDLDLSLKKEVEEGYYSLDEESYHKALKASLLGRANDLGRLNTNESSMVRLLLELVWDVALDFSTAVDMIRNGVHNQAIAFVKALDDELIVEFHSLLDEYRSRVAPNSKVPLQIKRDIGKELVDQALSNLVGRNPQYQVSIELRGNKGRGVWKNEKGVFEVTAQFVTKLFRDYTNSDTSNKNHYTYNGNAWRGYNYAAILILAIMRCRRIPPGH